LTQNFYPQFEAVKVALKQDRTGYILTLNIHPDELDESIFRDYVGARYQVVMVRIGDDEKPVLKQITRTQKAAILCKDEKFQKFMGCRSEESATEVLCASLNVMSRTELHGNTTAQAKFDQLVKDYEDSNDPFT
jgi:hypothetical protein